MQLTNEQIKEKRIICNLHSVKVTKTDFETGVQTSNDEYYDNAQEAYDRFHDIRNRFQTYFIAEHPVLVKKFKPS